jgi:hypothetical protein
MGLFVIWRLPLLAALAVMGLVPIFLWCNEILLKLFGDS